MEAVKILERRDAIDWHYDEGADVLYLSVEERQSSEGIDIGDGLILRYDEGRKEVVGLTVLGLRARLVRGLAEGS